MTEYVDSATLTSWLLAAETARNQLMTGVQEIEVSYEGQGSVKYTQTNLDSLNAYIRELKERLARLTGLPGARRAHRIIC